MEPKADLYADPKRCQDSLNIRIEKEYDQQKVQPKRVINEPSVPSMASLRSVSVLLTRVRICKQTTEINIWRRTNTPLSTSNVWWVFSRSIKENTLHWKSLTGNFLFPSSDHRLLYTVHNNYTGQVFNFCILNTLITDQNNRRKNLFLFPLIFAKQIILFPHFFPFN